MKRKQNYSGISLTNKLFNMKKDFNPSRSRASRLCPGQTYGRNFTRSEVMVKGMVASSQPLATQIGLDI
jgi:gamma-glutamyltranspeptidase